MAPDVSLELSDYRQLNGKTNAVERKSRKSCSSCSTKLCFFCSGFLFGLLLSLLLLSSLQYFTQNLRTGRSLQRYQSATTIHPNITMTSPDVSLNTTITSFNSPQITSTPLTTQSLAEQLTTQSLVTTFQEIIKEEITSMTTNVNNKSETEMSTTTVTLTTPIANVLTTESTTEPTIDNQLTTNTNNNNSSDGVSDWPNTQTTTTTTSEVPTPHVTTEMTTHVATTESVIGQNYSQDNNIFVVKVNSQENSITSSETSTAQENSVNATFTEAMNETSSGQENSQDNSINATSTEAINETSSGETLEDNNSVNATSIESINVTSSGENSQENSVNVSESMNVTSSGENSLNATSSYDLVNRNETLLLNATSSDSLIDTLNVKNESESCSSSQFLCPNQTNCLSRDLLCDGRVDCLLEGWDESSCDENCLQNFKCNSSQCISQQNYCDGIWDCPLGSDELGCHVSTCQKGHFLCKDQSKCILGKQACDHVSHCPDHSDEIGCVNREKCESSGRFFCSEDGLCIDRALRCDSIADCLEASDELNCDTQSTCSEKNGFLCQNNECISRDKRCDGTPDCLDFSDEFQCLSVEKSSKIVFFFNSRQNTWSPLCAKEGFESRDADLLCHQMGEWHSKNHSFVSLIPKHGFWAINQTLFSNWCSTNHSVSLECHSQQCGQNSQNNSDSAPSGVLITDNNGSQCWSHVIASHWLILSAGCLKNLSSNVTQLQILSHKKELIDVKVDYLLPHFRYSNFRSLRVPDFDVSLVRTRTPLPPSPTCLPSHAIDPAITCFVVNPEEEVAFEVIESRVCNGSQHLAGSLTSRHFCGKSQLTRCLGVGEPLLCLSSSSLWFISGFVSFQYGCNGTHFQGYSYVSHPVVFSNVFSVVEWIHSSVGKQELTFDTLLYDFPETREQNFTSGEFNETKEEETSRELTSMPFN